MNFKKIFQDAVRTSKKLSATANRMRKVNNLRANKLRQFEAENPGLKFEQSWAHIRELKQIIEAYETAAEGLRMMAVSVALTDETFGKEVRSVNKAIEAIENLEDLLENCSDEQILHAEQMYNEYQKGKLN